MRTLPPVLLQFPFCYTSVCHTEEQNKFCSQCTDCREVTHNLCLLNAVLSKFSFWSLFVEDEKPVDGKNCCCISQNKHMIVVGILNLYLFTLPFLQTGRSHCSKLQSFFHKYLADI